MDTQCHHVIPISLFWPNIPENKIYIDNKDHRQLHMEQDVNYNVLRDIRNKTNHILVPNQYVMDCRKDLYLQFFSNARTCVKKQIKSIIRQVVLYNDDKEINYHDIKITDAVEELIKSQILYIKNIIWKTV